MARTGLEDSTASKESKESMLRVGVEGLGQQLERLRGNLDTPSDETKEQVRTSPAQDVQVKDPPNLVAESQRDLEPHTASVKTAQVQNINSMIMLYSATVSRATSDMFGDSPNAKATSNGKGVCEYPQNQRSTKF